MSESTPRIRWHHVNGTVAEWFGYAGTLTTALFQILHPVAAPSEAVMGSRFDEWALCATFPGAPDQARYGGRDDEAQDRLKAEAERWLEEFASSLGASFPEPDPRWAALGDWLAGQIQQDIAAERAAFADGLAYVEAAHSTRASACRAVLARMRELEAGQ